MNNSIDRRPRIKAHRGVLFVLLLFSNVITGTNIYRLQPILSSTMSFLSIDESQLGVLMSVITFVSLFMTILVGFAVMRLGYCLSLSLAMTLELVGIAVAVGMPTYAGIFASQLLLGLVNTVILVCAPSFMQAIYTPEEYAMRIGYINAGQTVGQGVVFLLLPTMILSAGITSAWKVFILPSAFLLICWLVLTLTRVEKSFAPAKQQDEDAAQESESAGAARSPLADPKMWILVIGVLLTMISAGAALNYSALFLKSVKGFSETTAGNITFTCTVVGVIACMLVGPVSRKFGAKYVYSIVILIMALLRFLVVVCDGQFLLTIVTAAQGIPAAAIVICTATIPKLCKAKQYVPVAVSMVSTATTGGLALSSVIFGKLITAIGYNASFLLFVPLSLAALISVLVITND